MRRAVVFVLAAILAACAPGGASKSSGVLTVGMPNGPQTENHNPFLPTSAASSLGYRYLIYEPLVQVNPIRPAAKGTPWLATAWEWADNYRKITFTPREKVSWSDGKPMTAADVAFSFTLLQKYPALNIHSLPIKSAAVTGDKVEVAFERPQFVNESKVLNVIVVPEHVWSNVPDPTTFVNPDPVGTGPYKLKTFTPQTTTVVRRDAYWQELPKVPEVQFTSYNDNSAQTTALASGTSQWSYVFMPNYKTLFVDKDADHHKLWFPSGLGIHGLWLNHTVKPFDNAALRQAMNDVIDRDAIFMRGESGLFPKVESPTGLPRPAGDPFLAPEYADAKHVVDVPKAKKRLADAGFKLEGSTLKDPSGKPVTIELTNPAGWSDYLTDLDIIKNDLQQIGITATVRTQTADAWTTDFANGAFQGSMRWTDTGATPYDIYTDVMDGNQLKPIGQAAGGNQGRYDNPEATKALEAYESATDENARKEAMRVLQKIMVEQVPMIPTSAAPIGAEYSTKSWEGWPSEADPYAPPQPTQPNAVQIVLKLRPAA